MDPDFRHGHLALDPHTPRLQSPLAILKETARVFASRLGFLSLVTLAIYVPGHLLYQFAAEALNIPSNGILSFVLLDLLDLVLSSLAIPAIVFGLIRRPQLGPAFRWGFRQWTRLLGKQFLVDITVILYGALLIVPGLIAMARLALVPVIVAIEGDREPDPLQRSRALSKGQLWRIVAVLLPLSLVDAAANFLLLGKLGSVDQARVIFALAESLIAVAGQLGTVAALLLYCGLLEPAPVQKKTAKL